MKYPKLPKGYSIRGADLGRCNRITIPEYGGKFLLRKLKLNNGGYDEGGAYWGHAMDGTGIYHAVSESDLTPTQEMFTWARDRRQAKSRIKEEFPYARFY